jgi:hypothetical protein
MSTTRRCAETTPTTVLLKSKMLPPLYATISCHEPDGSPSAFSTLVVARAMACALLIFPSDSRAAYTNEENVSNFGAEAIPTMNFTQARSNRVFRAAYSSTTPMATFTSFASNVVTALSYDSGGPGRLWGFHFEIKQHSTLYKCPHSSLVPCMRERPGRGEYNTHTGVANLLRKKVGFGCSGEREAKCPAGLTVIFDFEMKKRSHYIDILDMDDEWDIALR